MKARSLPARARAQTTNQITGDRRWLALVAVMISMFFSSLDQTVVSTAMPTIVSDLNGFNLYAWVFTGYILATAVTTPLYGRLSDMYGRKPFYIIGFSVFLIGSALSGLSQSMGMLIGARALQGVGAGAMMSMPRATIGDIFNPRERGRWMGLIMGVFGLSTIIGPTVGGWITDSFGWRWVFYINMPVALIAMAMVIYALPTVRTESTHRIDWTGSLGLAGFLVPILLAITWGGSTYAWGSWQEIALFGISAAMLTWFLLNERRVPEPIIALDFFKNGTFSSAMVLTVMVAMGMFAVMLMLPIFVQGVLSFSPQSSGYLMTPMMLAFMVAAVIGGQVITRTGRYKIQVVVGGAFMVAGSLLLTEVTVASTWTTIVVDMVVMGLGIGSLMPAMSTIVQNLFPYRVLGAVNATQQMANTLGGAIVSPILGTVLAAGFAAKLPSFLPPTLKGFMNHLSSPALKAAVSDPQGMISVQGQAAMQHEFSKFGPTGRVLFSSFDHAVKLALTSAVKEVFWVSVAFAVVAFAMSVLVREIPLKRDEFYKDSPDKA